MKQKNLHSDVKDDDRVRAGYYEEACRKMKNPETHCSRIKKALVEGRISEGRVNFLELDGFRHYLGNCERAILEYDGKFELLDYIKKDDNKNLIVEATLRKRK